MLNIIGYALLTFLLFVAERKLYRILWNRHLNIRLEFAEKSLFEGEKGTLSEIIENGKRLPLPMLKVKFQTDRHLEFTDTASSKVTDLYYRNDIFQIRGKERITRKLEFVAAKRGYYRIQNIDLVTADLFLSTEYVESQTTKRYLYVYPRPFLPKELIQSLQQINGEILAKRRFVEDPFEYRGIREYQPYDDMRSINWKATAKTGELKVNQKNYTSLQTIRIFFNLEDTGILKKESAVEASLRIVAGLAAFYLNQGIRVSCFGNGQDIANGTPMQVEAGSGAGQMQQIYQALARVDTAAKPLDFVSLFERRLMQDANGTITLLVSPNAYDDFVSLLSRCKKQDLTFVWFYPTLEKEEPEVVDTLRHNIKILHISDDRK